MSFLMSKNTGKKGIFFSVLLVFIFIFLFSFLSVQRNLVSFYSSKESDKNRINSLLGFYDSVVFDSERSLEIISKRATSSAINYITLNGLPLTYSNTTIAELILHGTINGEPQGLMESSTIEDWESTIEYLGSAQGFRANVTLENLVIQPEDSFHLSISFSLSVNLSDTMTDTNISKKSKQSISLSIENFEDPLYPLNTYGRAINSIRKTPHWNNYSKSDLTNLNDDLDNHYYHASLHGASFLDRLEGKYQVQDKYYRPNYIGLESFVSKDELFSLGLPVTLTSSNIDYIYFSGSSVNAFAVPGMPINFRIDNETTVEGKTHLQVYNVTVA